MLCILDLGIQRFRNDTILVLIRFLASHRQLILNTVLIGWLKFGPSLRSSYSNDDIYNADVAGIFFKLTPDKTLCFKCETCSGAKLSKEIITVQVAANMTGTDKRKLLIIQNQKSQVVLKELDHFQYSMKITSKLG